MATGDDAGAFREAVGATVHALRTDFGWSLRTLSEQSGISVPYLSEIERGRKEPSGAMLAQLSAAFGLTLPALLGLVVERMEDDGASAPVPETLGSLLRRLREAEADLSADELAELVRYADFLRWRRGQVDDGAAES